MAKAKRSCPGTLYIPADEKPELPRVRQSDEQTARVCFLAGHMPNLPPPPAAHGAGAAVPDRGHQHWSPLLDS